jgi:Flp pilus assembly protein TadB
LVALIGPALLGVVLVMIGLGAYAVVPVALGIGIAVVGWFLPTREAREAATNARLEFRTNLEFFLTLVAGERRARGSVEQALEEAVELSGSMPFVQMRRAIRRAALSGRKPWSDLRALGEELDVVELRNLPTSPRSRPTAPRFTTRCWPPPAHCGTRSCRTAAPRPTGSASGCRARWRCSCSA